MNLLRFSGIVSLAIVVACSGGGGSTGPGGSSNTGGNGGGNGGGSNDPYGGGNATCPSGSVCMLVTSYDPASLSVAKGATVNFVNNSGVSHTVTFDGTRPQGVNDVPLNSSGTYGRTFNDAGRFAFHCTQHVGMTGEIVVQ